MVRTWQIRIHIPDKLLFWLFVIGTIACAMILWALISIVVPLTRG